MENNDLDTLLDAINTPSYKFLPPIPRKTPSPIEQYSFNRIVNDFNNGDEKEKASIRTHFENGDRYQGRFRPYYVYFLQCGHDPAQIASMMRPEAVVQDYSLFKRYGAEIDLYELAGGLTRDELYEDFGLLVCYDADPNQLVKLYGRRLFVHKPMRAPWAIWFKRRIKYLVDNGASVETVFKVLKKILHDKIKCCTESDLRAAANVLNFLVQEGLPASTAQKWADRQIKRYVAPLAALANLSDSGC